MYGTTASASTYFQNRLHTRAWSNASEDKRRRALADMSDRINRLAFAGQKADPDQADQFPRKNESGNQNPDPTAPNCVNLDPLSCERIPIRIDTVVPQAILYATYEGAYALLDGVDPEKEYLALAKTSDGLQNARSTYDRTSLMQHIVAGIPSLAAWQYLQPYLRAADSVTISRV